ncbi:MAG TPA: type II toxin-antitoxin system VapC family toxin [Saprospiraceae bacterium]|nr:type II toxin-antitoxin system VapC family toxin [Saprospiraceae bacterium]
MNGDNLLIDTNIALYLLSGDDAISEFLDGYNVYLSFISELELLGYFEITEEGKRSIEVFLADCIIIDFNEFIKQHTIELKQKYRMKLPDAIIAATSQYMNIPYPSEQLHYLPSNWQ